MQPTSTTKSTPVAFILLACALVLAPLGLGSNRPLPFGMVQLLLALSFVCALPQLKTTPVFIPKLLKFAAACFGVAAVWAITQTLPFTPASWHHPLWAEAAAALGTPTTGRIVVDVEAAFMAISRLLTFFGVGVIAYVLASSTASAQKILHIIFITCCAGAALGLVQTIGNTQHLLWLPKWAYHQDVTGTFVNRNHFATYAVLGLLTGAALFWQSLRQHLQALTPSQQAIAWQAWLLRRGLPYTAALLLIIIALIFSHSRMGLLVGIAGLTTLVTALYIYHTKNTARRWLAVFFMLLLGSMAVLLVADSGFGRFAVALADNSTAARYKTWALTLQMIADNTWLGYGLGNFEAIFRLYRTEEILAWMHTAHSDWLELIFALGIPAALVFMAGAAALLMQLLHGLLTREHNGIFCALALAAATAALLHAAVDFSLQIPGVNLTLAALLGAGLAQSYSRKHLGR